MSNQHHGFSGTSGPIGETGFSGSSGSIGGFSESSGTSKDFSHTVSSGLTYQSNFPILEINEILPYGTFFTLKESVKITHNWMDKYNTIQLYE